MFKASTVKAAFNSSQKLQMGTCSSNLLCQLEHAGVSSQRTVDLPEPLHPFSIRHSLSGVSILLTGGTGGGRGWGLCAATWARAAGSCSLCTGGRHGSWVGAMYVIRIELHILSRVINHQGAGGMHRTLHTHPVRLKQPGLACAHSSHSNHPTSSLPTYTLSTLG